NDGRESVPLRNLYSGHRSTVFLGCRAQHRCIHLQVSREISFSDFGANLFTGFVRYLDEFSHSDITLLELVQAGCSPDSTQLLLFSIDIG
ncbi:hypothetical protein TELCIR_25300, partial [Teladorsagia circumcincta]